MSLLGNRIEGSVQMPPAFVPQVQSGELRILAVLGSKQEPAFPEVPTARKLGYAVILDMWRGIAVPKGTPKPVIAKLERRSGRPWSRPNSTKPAKRSDSLRRSCRPTEFGKLMATDDRKLAEVMKDLGLKKQLENVPAQAAFRRAARRRDAAIFRAAYRKGPEVGS